jgi:hypothetical protein
MRIIKRTFSPKSPQGSLFVSLACDDFLLIGIFPNPDFRSELEQEVQGIDSFKAFVAASNMSVNMILKYLINVVSEFYPL